MNTVKIATATPNDRIRSELHSAIAKREAKQEGLRQAVQAENRGRGSLAKAEAKLARFNDIDDAILCLLMSPLELLWY